MKAIRVHEFGGPEVMKLEDVPDPTPGPGQAGLLRGASAADGDGVTNVKPGDRVYMIETATGAYAQLAVCEAKHLFPLPENVSFAQGASLAVPYGTAHRALFDRG